MLHQDENLEIRAANMSDLSAIERLMAELNVLHANGSPSTTRKADPDIEYLTSVLKDPEKIVFLALDDDTPAGLIQLEIKQAPSFPSFVPRTYAYMAALVVSQSHKRQGVGTILTEKAEQWAAERGATRELLGRASFFCHIAEVMMYSMASSPRT